MKVFLFCFCFGACGCCKAQQTFTYKRGVLVTHWTGVVASRFLGISNIAHTYGASWFDEEDIAWIAKHGFDHLQIDVDVQWWFDHGNELNHKNAAVYRKAIDWANKRALGVVLYFDVHPFSNQPKPDLTTIKERAEQWRKISKYFRDTGDGLRFHAGDAESQMDSMYQYLEYYHAIRSIDADRFFYLSMPAEKNASIPAASYLYNPREVESINISRLNLEKYDKNVGISFTYFQPEIFIYQKPGQLHSVPFPGTVPNFTTVTDSTSFYPGYLRIAISQSNSTLTSQQIFDDIALVRSKAALLDPPREIYLRQFGLHFDLDSTSSVNYIKAVKTAAEENQMSWCIYDYESGRAIRQANGLPYPTYYGLDLQRKN